MSIADEKSRSADQQGKSGGGAGGAIVIILILLILIGAGAYFLLSKPGVQAGQLFDVLPDKCVMYFQGDLDQAEAPGFRDEMWKKLKESPGVKTELEKMIKEQEVDVDQDIMPWLGNQMAISFFEIPPTDNDEMKGAHFVVVFSIKDQKMAQEKIANKLIKKDNYTEEKYEDVNMWVSNKESKPTIAVVKGLLVMGNTTDDVKKCIDTANKKSPNIKENKQFMEVLGNIPAKSMGIFYMDMQEVAKAEEARSGANKDPEAQKMLKAMKGMGMGIAMKDGSFIGEGLIGMDKASDSIIIKSLFEVKPNLANPESLKMFPSDTTLFACTDINLIYNLIMKMGESQGGTAQMEQGKQQLNQMLHIDIDKDIIENMDGELAYALDFTQLMQYGMQGGRGDSPPPVVVAIKFKDPAKVQDVIGKLDNMAKASGAGMTQTKQGNYTLYGVMDMVHFSMMKNFLVLGVGNTKDQVVNILNNDMAEDKSLTQDIGYPVVKQWLNEQVIGVQVIKLDKVMEMAGPLMMMQMQQDPEKAAGAQAVMDWLKKYNDIWTVSKITDKGIKFHVLVTGPDVNKKGEK